MDEEQLKEEQKRIEGQRAELEAMMKRVQEAADAVAQGNANLVEAQAGFAKVQRDWTERASLAQAQAEVIDEPAPDPTPAPTRLKVHIRNFIFASGKVKKMRGVRQDELDKLDEYTEDYGRALLPNDTLVEVKDEIEYVDL